MNSLSRREEETLLKITKAYALRECDDVVKGRFSWHYDTLDWFRTQQLLRSARLVGLFLSLGHVEKSCRKSKVVWFSCKDPLRTSLFGLPLTCVPALDLSPWNVSDRNTYVCELKYPKYYHESRDSYITIGVIKPPQAPVLDSLIIGFIWIEERALGPTVTMQTTS